MALVLLFPFRALMGSADALANPPADQPKAF